MIHQKHFPYPRAPPLLCLKQGVFSNTWQTGSVVKGRKEGREERSNIKPATCPTEPMNFS